jgi:hypothetical protein
MKRWHGPEVGLSAREFGRLKNERARATSRRWLGSVRLHADLTILAKLACSLAATRTLALAA